MSAWGPIISVGVLDARPSANGSRDMDAPVTVVYESQRFDNVKDAIMFAAIDYILTDEQNPGVISMNWYTSGPPRLRVYTGLVAIVGRKGKQRRELQGSTGYLEFSEVKK